MPICSRHPDEQMIRVCAGTETIGSGWDVHKAYYEDYVCQKCGFRVRQHFTIIDLGRGEKHG